MDEVKQKIALFIDADNAPASKFEKVLSKVEKYGLVTVSYTHLRAHET